MKREELNFVKKLFAGKEIVGAEVGLYQGVNSQSMLDEMPNLRLLYCIDPFLVVVHDVQPDILKVESFERLKVYGDRVHWIYKPFEILTMEDFKEKLDFIYIDGNHTYEDVKKDIELSKIFVKPGGVIGGHDYLGENEVVHAVREFVAENKLDLTIMENFAFCGVDWWVINK